MITAGFIAFESTLVIKCNHVRMCWYSPLGHLVLLIWDQVSTKLLLFFKVSNYYTYIWNLENAFEHKEGNEVQHRSCGQNDRHFHFIIELSVSLHHSETWRMMSNKMGSLCKTALQIFMNILYTIHIFLYKFMISFGTIVTGYTSLRGESCTFCLTCVMWLSVLLEWPCS